MNNQPSTPLDRSKTIHHSRWTDYTLHQFDDEEWHAATNDANNGQDAARATATTRPDPHLIIQEPPKPLSPLEPPPPQPRRPRPGTATGNNVRQRVANHHQSGHTLPHLKSQSWQGTRGGTAPGDAPGGQRIELEQPAQRTLSGSGPGNHIRS